VLAAVSQEFARVATDYASLLAKIARTSADLIGDGCLVTLVDGDFIVNAANAHVDPELEVDYRTYVAALGLSVRTSPTVAADVIRTGQTKLVPEVDGAALLSRLEPELRPIVERLDVSSYVVVPIRSHDAVIGALSLFRTGGGRSYDEADAVMLADLADRAGLAIDNARLYAQLEARVSERTRELEIANHELEAFSYSVAHDLRAPLRSIDGFAHAIQEDHDTRLDPEAVRMLDRIRGSAQHMAVLIDGLLRLAQIARANVQRSEISLSELAAEIVADLREHDPARVVEVAIEPGLIAHGDRQLVKVILQNLLGNAWKFTAKRDDARIALAIRDGAFVVRDNGAGFDPTYAHKLFVPFQRLHSAAEFPGTGIGLGTVHRAVQRHGGRIWAEGAVGAGAAFWFTLPG